MWIFYVLHKPCVYVALNQIFFSGMVQIISQIKGINIFYIAKPAIVTGKSGSFIIYLK